MRFPALAALAVLLALPWTTVAAEPTAEPTFNCIGLYWKPEGAAADRPAAVAYRRVGENTWYDALPLWFDPSDHAAEGAPFSRQYRGSIVHLKPATEYEIRLTLQGAEPVTLRARTWDDQFKIARTVMLPADPKETVVIKEGGDEKDGYVLYTVAPGTVWDAAGKVAVQVSVEASYVIVRGLTLRNAAQHGVVLRDVDHVVVEHCDISGWGRIAPDGWGHNLDAAVYSASKKLSHAVVQRNRLHHPRSDSNSWNEKRTNREGKESFHPIGPQAIVFLRSAGHHVIRFNRIDSDLQHMFNDGMGETHNFSFDGFPGRDSDIHDNFISHCWDDGIEAEGADLNVRVWNNYIDTTYGAIGAASPSLGPLYIWRNVYGVSRKDERDDENALRGHYLVKLGNENPEWTQGRMYIFHNTTLQPPPFPGRRLGSGAQAGSVFTSAKKTAGNIVSRNNLIDLRRDGDWAIKDTQLTPSNDWNHDMHNGRVQAREGSYQNVINASPTYDRAPDGRLWLRPGAPGHDAGVRLPNFNDDFVGAAPDMGAVETDDRSPKPELWPAFPEPHPRPPTTQPTTGPASRAYAED